MYHSSGGMLITGESVHVLGQGVYGTSVFSIPFCCSSKVAPKNKNKVYVCVCVCVCVYSWVKEIKDFQLLFCHVRSLEVITPS